MPLICSETTHALSRPRPSILRPPAPARPSVPQSRLRMLDRYKPSDEAEHFIFGVIKRFHRGRRRDAPRAFKRVSCRVVDAAGQPKLDANGRPLVRRYIWEVACFQSHKGREWNLVRWGIDTPGVWFIPLESQRAVMAAFCRSPESEQDTQ